MNIGRGVGLEIVEHTNDPDEVGGLNVVIPNHVTINGLPVLVPKGGTIQITAEADGGVIATVPMFVGSLRILAERPPLDEPTPIYFEAREHVYGIA